MFVNLDMTIYFDFNHEWKVSNHIVVSYFGVRPEPMPAHVAH